MSHLLYLTSYLGVWFGGIALALSLQLNHGYNTVPAKVEVGYHAALHWALLAPRDTRASVLYLLAAAIPVQGLVFK